MVGAMRGLRIRSRIARGSLLAASMKLSTVLMSLTLSVLSVMSVMSVMSTGVLVGCEAARERPRNVLLVSLDSVRADHLGAYGREDAVSPTLDALAQSGTLFAQAVAPTPLTLPSHATLVTGRDPYHHGVRHDFHHRR